MDLINAEDITNKQRQEISGDSGEKSRKFCVLGMQPQAAVLARYLQSTWTDGNSDRVALLCFPGEQGSGQEDTTPLRRILYRDPTDGLEYKVVPFNDLYDNSQSELPLLNKLLKNMEKQGLLKIRYANAEANPMKHKRTEYRANREFDIPNFKGGKITPANYVELLDETLILILEKQWDELIDSLIHYDGAKTKEIEDKVSEGVLNLLSKHNLLERAKIVPLEKRKGKPLEDYETTKQVIAQGRELEKTKQMFHVDSGDNGL